MLEVNAVIQEKTILPKRFFVFRGGNEDFRAQFPIDEKFRDLIYLIIALHYIECQEPSQKKLLLNTNYVNEFNEIKIDLEELYNILTGRKIELLFKHKTAVGTQQTFESKIPLDDIVLFSGGVDSLSGSIKMIQKNPNTALLNNPSNRILFGKIKKILDHELFTNTYTYFINSKIKTDIDRSRISDTRGLLYLVSGYALSKNLKSKRLHFCENGGQLLDVILGNEVYVNSYATKNTNLKYLKLIEKLISKFEGVTFPINYIFKNNTKAEIISKYLNEELINLSWSCYSLRSSKMCGSCWNCFITKMSSITADVIRDESKYEYNPLTQVIQNNLFLYNQNILYDMLVFYEKVINDDKKSLELLSDNETYFDDPIELGRNFGLDIFYGVQKTLKMFKERSGLGRKAEELLLRIDDNILKNRHDYVISQSHI